MKDENDKKDDEMGDILIPNPDLNDIVKDTIPLCSPYWILSIIYWPLFLLTGCFEIIQSIKNMNNRYIFYSIIWSIFKFDTFNCSNNFFLGIHINVIYILFIITLIFTASEFAYFLTKSTCKRDNYIYNSLMGKISKYHFIPILLATCFSGIGIYINFVFLQRDDRDNRDNTIQLPYILFYFFNINIYGIIFSIFILTSLLIIYTKIEIQNEKFLKSLLIHKGAFSCLISLSIYTLFNNIFCCIFIREDKKKDDGFFSISFHLIIGILNLVLSIRFKDIILAMMNFIIYLGMTLDIFSFWENSMKAWNEFANTPVKLHLSFDIIMMILSFASIIFIIFWIRVKNKIT